MCLLWYCNLDLGTSFWCNILCIFTNTNRQFVIYGHRLRSYYYESSKRSLVLIANTSLVVLCQFLLGTFCWKSIWHSHVNTSLSKARGEYILWYFKKSTIGFSILFVLFPHFCFPIGVQLIIFVAHILLVYLADQSIHLCLFYTQILLSEARVLGVGPKFMSIYIHKLAVSGHSSRPYSSCHSFLDFIVVDHSLSFSNYTHLWFPDWKTNILWWSWRLVCWMAWIHFNIGAQFMHK